MDGYEQFTDTRDDPEKLRSLGTLIQHMQEEEAEVARLEKALKAAKERLYAIRDQAIPDAMEEAGLEEFKTTDGTVVGVKRGFSCSIAGDKKYPALQWLDRHGHGAVIKRSVQVAFDKEQQDMAAALSEELRREYPNVKEDMSVHPSTLKSLLRELLARGEAVPLDMFGVYEYRKAVVKKGA